MAWDEANAWLAGAANKALYQNLLDDATTRPSRIALRKKIVHPDEMPWEMSRQGLLKHLLNEADEHPHGNGRRLYAGAAARQPVRQASASRRGMPLCGRGFRLRPAPGLRRRDHRYLRMEAAGRDQALRMGSRRRHLYSALHHPSALQRRSGTAGAADLLHQPHLQEFRPQRSSCRSRTRRNTIRTWCSRRNWCGIISKAGSSRLPE